MENTLDNYSEANKDILQKLDSITQKIVKVTKKNEKAVIDNKKFLHSPDYRNIVYNGKAYFLPPLAAQAVKQLYKAYKNDTPEISISYILEKIDSNNKRIQDIFFETELLGNLVIKGTTKGTYKLNL